MKGKNHNADTKQQLKIETEKWLARIKKEMPRVKENAKNKDYIKNINAYISDSGHWLQKGELIKAFEAVTFAWGILDTLKRLDLV